MIGRRMLKPFLVLCWLSGINFLSIAVSDSNYHGYSLIRITPITSSQLEYVKTVAEISSSLEVDFWLTTTAVNKSADVLVPPTVQHTLFSNLRRRSIPFWKLIEDVGEVIQKQSDDRREDEPNFFSRYRNLEEIYKYVRDLVDKHRVLAQLIDFGTSSENISLLLIKVSSGKDFNKPGIWIQGGAHGREHIGPAVVLFMAKQLLTEFEECNDAKSIVKAFDWYFLPVANPDGYKYSWEKNRLWRKTRSFNSRNPDCFGVDFNRNWGFQWNDAAGSSSDPCSHTFAGLTPFSEPETLSLSNHLLSLRGKLLMFLDVHSYSQKWLTPWGYTTELPPNYEAQRELAVIATEALRKLYGTKYTIGSSAETLYTVSGGARDWAYGVAGASYSYTVELRDNGTFGFLLPDSEIGPTANETWIGLKAMAVALKNWHS